MAGPQLIIEEDQASSQPWYKSKKMLLVLGAYGSIAFLMNFLEELTPIFASAPYDKVLFRALHALQLSLTLPGGLLMCSPLQKR